MIVSFRFPRCLGGSTFIGAVPLFATMETESFPDASRAVGRGEFSEVDSVHFHGIGVFGRL